MEQAAGPRMDGVQLVVTQLPFPSEAGKLNSPLLEQQHMLQSERLEWLRKSEVLLPEEEEILRWGGNAKWTKPNRNVSSHCYREASMLEVLVCLQWLLHNAAICNEEVCCF
jgi:hypothetical protein